MVFQLMEEMEKKGGAVEKAVNFEKNKNKKKKEKYVYKMSMVVDIFVENKI